MNPAFTGGGRLMRPTLLAGLMVDLGLENEYASFGRQFPKFHVWSGSHHPALHHYGDGGLKQHTTEVIGLGLTCLVTLGLENEVPRDEYVFAALFHDLGKTEDYERALVDYAGTGTPIMGWKSTEHKRLIHHVSRSALMWASFAAGKFDKDFTDRVTHCILAHHGTREHGSPVAPKARTAWLLHLCDGISARMDDADRHDILHKPS